MDEEEIKEISERMGEAAHNAWMEKRRKEKGWHSPEAHTILYKHDYPSLTDMDIKRLVDTCTLCHPCMRPYSELPDSEKELDRAYPALFLKILGEMGYVVVKKEKIDALEWKIAYPEGE